MRSVFRFLLGCFICWWLFMLGPIIFAGSMTAASIICYVFW